MSVKRQENSNSMPVDPLDKNAPSGDQFGRALVKRARGNAKLIEAEAVRLATRETSAARRARKPLDLAKARTLVRDAPKQPEGAGRVLRRLRDRSRY